MSFIGILFLSIPFLIAFGLGVLLPSLVVLLYSRFGAGLVVVACSFVVDALTMGNGGLNLGLHLFFADSFLLIVCAAAVLRLLFAADFPLRHRSWLSFCVLIIVSLIAGLAAYGTAAGVQARPYFYFVVTGLYAMSFPVDGQRIRLTLNVLVAVAVILLCLTVYRWIVYYTPIPSLMPEEGTYNLDGPIRVIKSLEALTLAQALVGGLFFSAYAKGLKFAQGISPLLLGATLALQHRSVWLAALAGILIRFVVVRSRQASTGSQIALMAGVVLLTVAPMLLSSQLSGVSQQVAQSTERVLQGADTTGERLNNWKATIKLWYEGGPKSILIGQGFGGDGTRYVEDPRGGLRKITYFAHNFYVQTLFNTGIVGLGAILMAFGYILRGLYRLNKSGEGGSEAQVLLVLMAMQVAYYVPYGTDYLQSFLFGIALAYVAGKTVVPAPIAESKSRLRRA